MTSERLKEIDVLRALAFIFVVVQHTLGGFSNIKGIPYSNFIFMKLMYVMAKTAVPMFLFISAVGLFYVYYKKFEWKKYYIKRIKFVLIPYIIWSAINMYKLGNEDRFKDFFVEIIAGNGAFHLWYMGMVIGLFIIFPAILWFVRKVHPLSIEIRTAVFTIFTILYYYVAKYQTSIADAAGKFIFGTPTEVQQRILNISILFWYLYFMLGICFILNYDYLKEKLLKYKILIYICYGLLYIYAFLNETDKIDYIRVVSLLYIIFSITTFYLISVKLAKNELVYKALKFIGDYSFAAYMAHVIVVNYMANQIMLDFNTHNYLFTGILTLIITVVLTPVIIKILSFFPYSEYITGVKRSSIE
ncbi:MAG: acyltransferase [Solirubrobacterales bacterium]